MFLKSKFNYPNTLCTFFENSSSLVLSTNLVNVYKKHGG